jgi:hypothetical protein
MTITLDRALPSAPRHQDPPVLAVLTTDDPNPQVLVWAAAAAQALDTSLCVVYLEPRLGFTTSPALVASAARRRRAQLARCRQLVAEALDGFDIVEVSQLRYAVSSRPRSRHRSISDAVRRTGAQLVVVSADPGLVPSASWPEVLRVDRSAAPEAASGRGSPVEVG